MNSIISYITGSIEELHLVQWPTQQQTIRLTVIVVGFIIATAIAFGLIDLLFTEFLRATISI